ncbi:serine/threonine-protein kinase OXI1 [Andrographis paniculata]|uniref:serine/threonine-protein kinase OXI1 n=1 Tax=Andrographis paniculata TaxID=175694 RepID=UPI0021E8315A|nr:serine/threonine-protein kinase OXI1 [Andrographis paniculata]
MRDGAAVESLDLNRLKVISALGRGAKGVVFLVQTASGELLALKAISRSSIEKKKKLANGSNGDEYRRVLFERDVLASFNHPLLPKLHGVLRTDKIVGYAIDYCSGRDLNYLRKKQTEKMFSDDIIRFYAAELVLALEHLHNLGIVYRDLKPENVMVQENGHLMLVDFDLSTKLVAKSPDNRSTSSESKPENKEKKKTTTKKKKSKKLISFFNRRCTEILPEDSVQLESESIHSESDSVEKSNSFVGTEEYVAPEIILGNGHDFSVDWWCLGIMLYELLYGKTPFRGETRKDTFSRIISRAPNLTGEATQLRDLIAKLLEKDPKKRISVHEIKAHEFFRAVDWNTITEMPRPPFIPELTDVDNAEEIDVESYVQTVFQSTDEANATTTTTNHDENPHKEVWIHNHPTQIQNDTHNFLIF